MIPAAHQPTPRGPAVSTRVRILSLLLVISIAVVAVAPAATGRRANPHRAHAWVRDVSGPLLRAELRRAGRPARISVGVFAPLSSFGSALVGSAPVGNGPSAVALNPATHTIYVADGFNYSGPNALGDTVSVIDARHCNTQELSSCPGPWPTITVGSGTAADQPSGIAVDALTDTVYVSNYGVNTVSVVNGATCNAMVRAGCGQTPISVPVGDNPVGLFADHHNHTVYVPNEGDTTVSMIDSASCNATNPAGCPSTPALTVDVGANPSSAEADLATHTIYVSTFGAANGWAVFDADTCNATVQSGCETQGTLIGDPSGPNDAAVDTADDTLYTANYDNTVSAFNLSQCNAADLTGCSSQTAGVVTPFPDPGFNENTVWIAVDAALHTVYAVYNRDDALLAIDTNVCNGAHTAACATLNPPTIHTGAQPEGVVLATGTQTLYVADQLGNDVSVIDATRCNAQITFGCRHLPPAVALTAPGGVAVDAAERTAYVTTESGTIALIDTRRCSAGRTEGCAAAPPMVAAGDTPVAIAVSGPTHTIYVADYGSGATGAISVLDAQACAAAHPTGCATIHTLTVPGGHPDDLALDPLTGTLYVATVAANGPDLVTVFDAATCSATDAGGVRADPRHPGSGRVRQRVLRAHDRRQPADRHALRHRPRDRRCRRLHREHRIRHQRRPLQRDRQVRVPADAGEHHRPGGRLQRIDPRGPRRRSADRHRLHGRPRRWRLRHRHGGCDRWLDVQRPHNRRLWSDASDRSDPVRHRGRRR